MRSLVVPLLPQFDGLLTREELGVVLDGELEMVLKLTTVLVMTLSPSRRPGWSPPLLTSLTEYHSEVFMKTKYVAQTRLTTLQLQACLNNRLRS